jgi:hypothetical protein
VQWPPASVQRRKKWIRAGLFALLLAVGVSARPGGLAALVGPERLAAMPSSLQTVVELLSPPPSPESEAVAGVLSSAAPTSESIAAALGRPLTSPSLRLLEEPKVAKPKGLPRPKLPRALKPPAPLRPEVPRAKRDAGETPRLKTKARHGTPYSSPTRTATPLPTPERARPDAGTKVGEARLEKMTEEGLALLRYDGSALSGLIERERFEAEARARDHERLAASEVARVQRVQRRIDRVLAEVEASRNRASRGSSARRSRRVPDHHHGDSCRH